MSIRAPTPPAPPRNPAHPLGAWVAFASFQQNAAFELTGPPGMNQGSPDMFAVDATMFFAAGGEIAAGGILVGAGCLAPTPFEPLTCLGEVRLDRS